MLAAADRHPVPRPCCHDHTRADPEIEAVLGPARLAYFTPSSEFPILADRKAAFLLTASGLILTVLVFFMGPVAVLHGPRSLLTVLTMTLLVMVLALIVHSARAAYRAFVLPVPEMPTCIAFYRHLAVLTRDDYHEAIKSLTHPEALRNILHYNYSISCQGASKFRLVQRSLASMRIALVLWMLLLLVLSLTAAYVGQ